MKRLWRSPTLRTAVIYGGAGLGFAGANLILARVLPTAEYGLFTLVTALTNLSFAAAPLGVDGVVNRRHLEAGPILLKRTLSAGLITALVSIAVGGLVYGIDTSLLLLIFAATVGGGAMAVAAAQFQSERRYGVSLSLMQSPNIVIMGAALAVVLTGIEDVRFPVAISSFGYVVASVVGWWMLFGERAAKPHRETWFPWREALSLAGLNAAGLVLVQLDRLMIPRLLTLHDLATFGVLAAIAGSLFRVLAMGVGYTLLPRLRAAATVLERRRLILHEIKLVAVVIICGSLAIWFLTPWIERSFLAGKYHLDGFLVLATLFTGVARVVNSITRATAAALSTVGELATLNWLGWGSVGVALLAGIIGSRWGLAGLIYGVGLGWLVRGLTASYLTIRHLKLPESIPATAR